MVIDIKKEVITCILLLLCGIASGVIYDLFKALENKNSNKIYAVVKEIFYFVLIGVIVFNTIRFINDGNYRIYEFVFLCAGVFIYKISVSRYVLKFFVFIIKVVTWIIKRAIFLATLPFKWIFLLIKKFFCNKQGVFYKKILKNRLTIKKICFKIRIGINKIGRIMKNK